MLDKSPTAGATQGLSDIGHMLAASSTPPETILNALASFSTITNACIGISISILVIALLVFLIRWVVAADASEAQKIGARGAFRATLALFLAINIWSIMRFLEMIASLSPSAEYLVFLTVFVLLTAWSLFSITDGVVALLGTLVDTILNFIVRHVRKATGAEEVSEFYPGKWSYAFFRVSILLLLTALAFLAFS